MEERIIDDEYGRGVKLKKTKDGYVDVTDAELDESEMDAAEETVEEALFEFPAFDTETDDEELATLTPEEAMALKKRREEDAAARLAEYEKYCREGEAHLATGSFRAAELQFEKALWMDDEPTQASVGYWRAKTADFTNPDALVEEYVDAGIENLEEDIGYKAVDILRERYQSVFAKRICELETEEQPLVENVESKQIARRAVLKERLKKSGFYTVIAALPMLACLILAIVFAVKIPTVKDDRFILPTIICGAAFFLCFIVFLAVANKMFNVLRIRRANERISSTEEGQRLVGIRAYKAIYKGLLPTAKTYEK